VDPHHDVYFRPGARGKRRGFSPGAAVCHSQSARVHTEMIYFKKFVLLTSPPPLHNRTWDVLEWIIHRQHLIWNWLCLDTISSWWIINFRFRIAAGLEPGSPLNRAAKSGKIRHFQAFEVWTFVPAIFWFLVVCMTKMWSDRKNK